MHNLISFSIFFNFIFESCWRARCWQHNASLTGEKQLIKMKEEKNHRGIFVLSLSKHIVICLILLLHIYNIYPSRDIECHQSSRMKVKMSEREKISRWHNITASSFELCSGLDTTHSISFFLDSKAFLLLLLRCTSKLWKKFTILFVLPARISRELRSWVGETMMKFLVQNPKKKCRAKTRRV